MQVTSIRDRVVTLDDLARYFEVPDHRLERILIKHRIDPAFRLGRIRAYGPSQARRIAAVLGA